MSSTRLYRLVLLIVFLSLCLSTAASTATLLPPSNLSATPVSASAIKLTWSDPNPKTILATETGYSIERSPSATGVFVQIGQSAKGVTTYQDAGLAESTTYYYRVRALGRYGVVSSYSSVASATTIGLDTSAPSVPTGLTAAAASCSQINLSWTASTDAGGSGLAGYKVFRNGVQIATMAVTSYSNTGLVASSSYSYTVAAYDNAGNTSAQGTAAGATTPACADTTAPSVPTGLTAAAASCSQINLSWTASTDAGGSGLAGYKLFRNGVQIATMAVTSYSNTGLVASSSYSYTVAAYDNAGNTSAQGTAAGATTPACADTTAPSVPTGLTAAAASCSQINLSWTASTDAGGSGLAGYKVFRNGVQIATMAVTSYSNTGLAASTSYSYTVAAYDNAGNTSAQGTAAGATTPACADTTAPSVPTGLTAAAASCSQINLSWTASTDMGGSGLAGYKVFRNGVQIATMAVTSYSNTGLAASTSYSYTVAAYDNAGNTSAQGTAAGATTPACADTTAPSVPTGLTATAASCSQINLSWTASTDTGGSGLAGYKLFRNGVQIATMAVTSYSNTGLAASTSYSYTVAAYDGAGNTSAQGTVASVTTPACTNQPPTAYAGPDQTTTVGTAVTFDGSGSSDPDGTITSYAWTFGDGASAAGAIVTHSYFAAGIYWATLTVTDNQGATASDTTSVEVVVTSGGAYIRSQRFGGAGSDIGRKIALDANNNILVTGTYGGTANFGGSSLVGTGGDDIFLAKYSGVDGAHLWSKGFGSTGADQGSDIAVDTNGDVFVVGFFTGTVNFGGGPLTSAGGTDIFVAKYRGLDGAHLWSKRFGSTDNDSGNGVAVDSSGNVVVTGSFRWTVDFGGVPLTSAYLGASDIFLAKYSGVDGAHLWSKNFLCNGSDSGSAVALDSSNNIFLTGTFFVTLDLGGGPMTAASNTAEDIFLAKFSATGQHLWSKRFGNVSSDYGQDIAVDRSGDVVFTGYFFLTVDFGGGPLSATGADIFVAKYRGLDGVWLWSKHFPSTGTDIANSVALDSSGDVLVTGYFAGTVDFGSGPLTASGPADIFIAKYSGANGAHLWSHRFGGSGYDTGVGVAVRSDDKVVVTGCFAGTVDFGGGPLTASGYDVFLLTLWP